MKKEVQEYLTYYSPEYIYIPFDKMENLALRKEVSDSLTEASGPSISTSTGYHQLKYVKDLSTNFYFYDNQYSVATTSAFTSSSASINLHATVRSVNESIDARFEWIRVRKYANPEPIVSIQSEESSP